MVLQPEHIVDKYSPICFNLIVVNEQLLQFVRRQRSLGDNDSKITSDLQGIGWKNEDINQALAIKDNNIPLPPSSSPIMKNASTSAYGMWDAFEHVLLFISLYALATSIAVIFHNLVDRWFPNITASTSSYQSSFSAEVLRWSLASLIVSFPLFSFLFLHVTKKTKEQPAIRNLKARKTWIYITLVGTFLIMLFKIISTIYNFLNGNISLNFIIHLIVTLTITGIIFTYYVYQVREDRKINV